MESCTGVTIVTKDNAFFSRQGESRQVEKKLMVT